MNTTTTIGAGVLIVYFTSGIDWAVIAAIIWAVLFLTKEGAL